MGSMCKWISTRRASAARRQNRSRILRKHVFLSWATPWFGDSASNRPRYLPPEWEAVCRNLEVINFGVSGYGTDQELLLFKEQGKKLKPDVVVLVVSGNDFGDNLRSTVNVYYQKPVFRIEQGRLVLTNRPVPAPNFFVKTASSIARQSFILTQLGRTIQGLASAGETAPDPVEIKTTDQEPKRSFPRSQAELLTATLIQEFVQEVEDAGARPALIFKTKLGHLVSAFLGLNGVPVLQWTDLEIEPNNERFHLPQDFHWNPDGHELVAQALLKALVDNGHIQPCDA